MHRLSLQALLALILVGSMTVVYSSGIAIGVAVSSGAFLIDNSKVFGNATVFSGSKLETAGAPSQLRLNNGVRVELAADSRARVSEAELQLEKGYGEFRMPASYRVGANHLQIASSAPNSVAKVALGRGDVMVEALQGRLEVSNAEGMLIAMLNPGKALSFQPGAGREALSTLTGQLQRRSGRFVMDDETTNITVELRGNGLANAVGQRVRVTGKASHSDSGFAQLVQVASLAPLTNLPQNQEEKKTGGQGGGTGTGTGTGTGMSAGTKVAIIVAVVGGAGLAAGIAATRGKDTSSPQ